MIMIKMILLKTIMIKNYYSDNDNNNNYNYNYKKYDDNDNDKKI